MVTPERAYIKQVLAENEQLEQNIQAVVAIAGLMWKIAELEDHRFPGPPFEGDQIDVNTLGTALQKHLEQLQGNASSEPTKRGPHAVK